MALLVSMANASTCRRQVLFDFPTPSRTETYVTSVSWEGVKAWRVSGLQIDLAHRETLKGILRILVSDNRTLALPVSENGIDFSNVALPDGVTVVDHSTCVL
jgi:hypothetical protein